MDEAVIKVYSHALFYLNCDRDRLNSILKKYAGTPTETLIRRMMDWFMDEVGLRSVYLSEMFGRVITFHPRDFMGTLCCFVSNESDEFDKFDIEWRRQDWCPVTHLHVEHVVSRDDPLSRPAVIRKWDGMSDPLALLEAMDVFEKREKEKMENWYTGEDGAPW